ncbi:flippase [Halorubrum sp. GN11GM_10-3_MGM]|uniref:flippase n=1 Tax=Halorubrum sp. GN11GM_10-3_MGM TaxID=2518111 RepID=UPI0010F5F938|nr:flippase [Halorubrum sp. GN11GM_10-3_MGM]TKX67637.1 flippase [Halorubrum sp. GN11GM_10-3_MGM]
MGDNGVGRVRRNAIYLFLGVVVANLASFLFRALLAREFGPGGFGVFSLALMITSIATVVALLGLPDGVITFVSKFNGRGEHGRVVSVVAASFGLSFGIGILLAIVVVLAAPVLSTRGFDSPALADVLWWFAWIIPANVIVDISAAYFLGIQRGEYNTIIKQVLPKTTLLMLVAAIAVTDSPLVAVGVGYLVATGFAAAVGFIAVGMSLPVKEVAVVRTDIRELVSYSLPLLATSAIGLALNWTDVVVVGYILGSDAVGMYQAAFVLAANIHIFLGAISGSLYPNFSSLLADEQYSAISRQFTEGTRWAVLITTAPAIYLVGFPSLSLEMLFGNDFTGAATVLAVLVAGKGLVILFGPSTDLLKAVEESRYVAITYGLAAVLNLALNVALVPVAGIVGAAFGTAIATMFGNYLHFRRTREHVNVTLPIKPLLRALVAGLAAYLPCLFLISYVESLYWFGVHIALFSILYLLTLFAFGGISLEEIRTHSST